MYASTCCVYILYSKNTEASECFRHAAKVYVYGCEDLLRIGYTIKGEHRDLGMLLPRCQDCLHMLYVCMWIHVVNTVYGENTEASKCFRHAAKGYLHTHVKYMLCVQ